MLGRQHLIFGITTATALMIAGTDTNIAYFQEPIAFILGSSIGSVFPDIDETKSLIGRKFPIISYLINKLIGHRTYTHDLALILPLSVILTIRYPWLFGFFFGYLGHIFLDGLTAQGIPFFYLFNKKRIHLLPYFMKFKSDSLMAKMVTILSSIFVIAIIRVIKDFMIFFA